MKQLRVDQPSMADVDTFVSTVQRLQEQESYQLAALQETNDVIAVAGFRIGESLAHGKELYVYGKLCEHM
jgi:hypothetical protein